MRVELLAALSVAMSVAGQFALRAGMVRTPAAQEAAGFADLFIHTVRALSSPLVLGGLALYVLAAMTWLSVLARWEVSKAYPLIGLGFVLSALVGFGLGESVGLTRWLGILLITLGVFVVSLS